MRPERRQQTRKGDKIKDEIKDGIKDEIKDEIKDGIKDEIKDERWSSSRSLFSVLSFILYLDPRVLAVLLQRMALVVKKQLGLWVAYTGTVAGRDKFLKLVDYYLRFHLYLLAKTDPGFAPLKSIGDAIKSVGNSPSPPLSSFPFLLVLPRPPAMDLH